MIRVGEVNNLKVLRFAEFGVYLDDGDKGILLPRRFVPEGLQIDDMVDVFVYHDSEDRLIATTQTPIGKLGDIVKLAAVTVTEQGAFLNNGLMKDLFVPRSKQIQPMRPYGEYLVKIYIDEQTGRLAGTQFFDETLSNDNLTVKVLDEVNLVVYRRTDIGYVVIINNIHTGVLHHNEIFRDITEGDRFKGFIKKIYENNNIDVVAGKSGYKRVEDEAGKILRLLEEAGGTLPYHDKSEPDLIYSFFGMSKKTFKMTLGNLYKQQKIAIEPTGISLKK